MRQFSGSGGAGGARWSYLAAWQYAQKKGGAAAAQDYVGKLYKNGSYAGITPDFWNSCDAVAGQDEWRMYGLINCGKGQPGQVMRVGHGASPARFQNVRVGVA